ncbi:hypothetical protein [Streptomyces sp. NPDC002133]|uniref:hypothetical protein n=1 Tax=Streptomyces sp. NPDC002133 TaxID=3154409 RepID=UPI00332122DF
MYDADSGVVLVRRELDTVEHGAGHHVHPVDGSIYLDIGEGQDGSVIIRGTAGTDGEPEFVTYSWSERRLIDLAPGGEQFMTVDHGQADVAYHRHPDGEVLFAVPIDAFRFGPEDTFVEWSGGYLTPDTAVVTVGGEGQDEEEWFRYHLVDVRTGTVSGEIAIEVTSPYELQPLGDGSWLTDGPDGNPVRWSRAALTPAPTPGPSRTQKPSASAAASRAAWSRTT